MSKMAISGMFLAVLAMSIFATAFCVGPAGASGMIAIHDVAITDLSPSKTIVGQGQNLDVNMTVANQGNYTETFNVTLCASPAANSSGETFFIQGETIALESGGMVTLKLAWDTTGYEYGNYTISACAWPVPGETNTTDNTRTSDIVEVTIVGDVDGDFDVDMLDVTKITGRFGTRRGNPVFSPSTDINNDDAITILDVVLCTVNYGGHAVPLPGLTKYPFNPVMRANLSSWEGFVLGEADFILDSGTFKMWYRANFGSNSAIGYATSSDALSWTRYESNPVLTVTGGVSFPTVLKLNSTYYLYAAKFEDNKLYRWCSSDGISWCPDNGGIAVLSPEGQGWESSCICNCGIIYEQGGSPAWRMLYEAKGTNASDNVFRIGYAFSSDGLNWTKYGSNPVLPFPQDKQAGNPTLLKTGNTYLCWFGCEGRDMPANEYRIFLANSSDCKTWTFVKVDVPKTQFWEGRYVTDPAVIEATGKNHKMYFLYTGNQNMFGIAYADDTLDEYWNKAQT